MNTLRTKSITSAALVKIAPKCGLSLTELGSISEFCESSYYSTNCASMTRESDTYIKTAFENILSNYLLARFEPFGREHALWRVFEGLSNCR
jgi:hypothetical protein